VTATRDPRARRSREYRLSANPALTHISKREKGRSVITGFHVAGCLADLISGTVREDSMNICAPETALGTSASG
jgi:hypothetical protein